MNNEEVEALAAKFIEFLETGRAANDLFTDDVFLDFTLPKWRLQAQGLAQVLGIQPRARFPVGAVIQRLEVSSWKLRSVGRKTEKIGIAVNCFAPMFVASQFQSYLFTAPAIGIRIEKKSIAGRLSF